MGQFIVRASGAIVDAFEKNFLAFKEKISVDERVRVRLIAQLGEILMLGGIPTDAGVATEIMSVLFSHSLRERVMDDHPDLVQRSLSFLNEIKDLPYQEELEISPWWQTKQRNFSDFIALLANPIDVIAFAQCTHLSSSDRRLFSGPEFITATVLEQLRQIEARHGICPPIALDIEESPYSIESSIMHLGAKRYSNSFLNMLGYALAAINTVNKSQHIARIVEIGSGYGNLARVIKLLYPEISLTLIDLPESLLLCHVYLSINFPAHNIALVQNQLDYDQAITANADFILIPVQMAEVIKGQEYDLAMNTCSMGEMPKKAVDYYIHLITASANCKFFYSFNYFINNPSILAELSCHENYQQIGSINPILPLNWQPVIFQLNPANLTVDCQGRNWLELLAQKHTPAPHESMASREQEAITWGEEANKFMVMSDPWLKCLWHSMRLFPTRPVVNKLMTGIELFTMGWNRPNHMFTGIYGAPGKPDASVEERRKLFSGIEVIRYCEEIILELWP